MTAGSIFICIDCGAPAVADGQGLKCTKCYWSRSIEDGVFRISSSPSYWHNVPKEEIETLISDTKSKGWKKALLESPSQKVRSLYLWADCPSRADSAFYLPLNKNSVVLDLGSGWGSYTFALAPRVKEVVAADSNLEALRFISLRAQQDNNPNIKAVNIDPLDTGKLPFADGQFDAVIMNGVLEWVGSFLKTGDPLRIQRQCLREVCRVLKKGGALLVGIENRFGLSYFKGAPDDHLLYYSDKTKVAYTTLMPRAIANIVTKIKLGVPYRTYTHSFWGLRRLLKSAGFGKIEPYFPVSGYRAASTKIIPLKSKELKPCIDDAINAQYLRTLVSFAGAERLLCDSYFMVAEK